jgi:hypothetical protein
MEEKIIVKLEADIADLKTQLGAAESELKRFGIGVEQSIGSISLNSLNAQLRQLQTQLGTVDVGSQAFRNIGAEITLVENKINSALTSIGANANRSRSGFNGLNNSINQLTRELPAFGLSANIGFLAISNNLPILFDEIKKVTDANKALAASGLQTTSVFKQLSAALFSWQTALSVGVTLLTIYGAQIIALIGQMFGATTAIDSTKEKLNALNAAYKSDSLSKAIADNILLGESLNQAKGKVELQKGAIDKYNETIGAATKKVNTFKEAEEGYVAYTDTYINSIIARVAAETLAASSAKEYIALKQKIAQRKAVNDELNQLYHSLITNDENAQNIRQFNLVNAAKNQKKVLDGEISDLEGNINKRKELIKSLAKDFVINPGKPEGATGDRGIPQMDQMMDTSDQIAEAKKLFDFYKQQGPESFNLLGEAYINNPFFKALIDEELSKKTLKLREDFDKLGKSPTWTDPAMLQYIQNLQNIANLIGNTLNSAFESALVSGENFFKVMWRGLTNLLYKLAAAAVAALVLSVLLAPWSGGAALAAVGGFEGIFSKLTGFDISGIGGGDSSVFMPNNAVGQGNYQIDIMGDKMRLLLDNTAIKNTRVI